jgi:hypothetical protein
MSTNFKSILYYTAKLQEIREKIDEAFKEYEDSGKDSYDRYSSEEALMKYGAQAQSLKAKIKSLQRKTKIS